MDFFILKLEQFFLFGFSYLVFLTNLALNLFGAIITVILTYFFIRKLKQPSRPASNIRKISKDEKRKLETETETETELPESKTIIEEKERCIKKILCMEIYMEDLVDKMVARLKTIHEYVHHLLFQTDNMVFLFVMNRKRRRYFLTHPERNIKDILKAFDADKVFKWTEECRKEMPIDYNFMICKGALSNFKGSKGWIGELSVVDSDSEDYDVIRFKAEPMPNLRSYDDGKDKVYLHARWFKLTELKYRFLVYLTLTTLQTLNSILGFELGMWDRHVKNVYCRKMLTHLCEVNENPLGLQSISYEKLTISRHEKLTISEYRTAVRELGFSNFKSTVDSWSKNSFDTMKYILLNADKFDESYIDFMEPWERWYNKYLQTVKRGRVPREGVWTFGPIICRYSKTTTAVDYRKSVLREVVVK